jgi:hypothetical protein
VVLSPELANAALGETRILSHHHRKTNKKVGQWWLTPVILVTQEAEIRRITVGS